MCISLACRQEGYPRTFQELSQVTGIPLKTLSQLQIRLAKELNLQVGRVTAESIIPRVNLTLGFSSSLLEWCRFTCQIVSEKEILAASPQNIAAVTILLNVIAYRIVLRHQAAAAAVTEATTTKTSPPSSSVDGESPLASLSAPQHLQASQIAAACAANEHKVIQFLHELTPYLHEIFSPHLLSTIDRAVFFQCLVDEIEKDFSSATSSATSTVTSRGKKRKLSNAATTTTTDQES